MPSSRMGAWEEKTTTMVVAVAVAVVVAVWGGEMRAAETGAGKRYSVCSPRNGNQLARMISRNVGA